MGSTFIFRSKRGFKFILSAVHSLIFPAEIIKNIRVQDTFRSRQMAKVKCIEDQNVRYNQIRLSCHSSYLNRF